MKSTAICQGCGADIVWLKTNKGKNMPVDASSYNGEKLYEHGKHVPHWSTCPKADKFRKKDAEGKA